MRAEKLLLGTGDPAYAVDREGKIIAWNLAAESSFGYRAGAAVGRRCWGLLQGKDPFGNQYCCEHCPLRVMAQNCGNIRSCRLLFQTASNGLAEFNVATLVIFDEAGRELLVHLCRPVQGEGESPVAVSRHHGPAALRCGQLSSREKEVLALLSLGKTTREVAADLYLSTATVRNHVQHILRKLHAHSRLAAIVKAQKLGVV